MDDVDACLITHHHNDHISQVKLFERKPIYSAQPLDGMDVQELISLIPFEIKGIRIIPFALSHDAEKTMGFVFEADKEKLVYVTDTGYLPQAYYPLLQDADYIIMESNHDIEMLMESSRPHFLKSRIYSDQGHLCNEDCAEVLDAIVTEKTKEIVLAHLSEEANTPQKALEASVTKLMNKKEKLHPQLTIMVAKQYEILQGGTEHEKKYLDFAHCLIGMV